MLAFQTILLFLGCASFPLYLLPTGGVQLGHVLFACAGFLALLSRKIRFSGLPAAILLALAVLAFWREAFAVFSGAPVGSVKQGAFVLFNLMTFVAVQTIYAQTGSVASYKWGIVAAAVVALGPLLASGVDLTGDKIEQRAIGTFQNPNQLAYFATILFSLTALLYAFGHISGRLAAAIVGASFMLIFAALSKAGIVGMFVGLMFLMAGNVSGRRLAAVALAGVIVLLEFGVIDPERLLFFQRFQDIGSDPDDSLAQRGYLVLIDGARQPLEVWFGLGEQTVRAVNRGHEIHSTYLAFFGLYGVAGGLLYLAFLGSWMRALVRTLPLLQAAAILAPPLLYGIAHNGTRFSIFYVLVALTFCFCDQRRLALAPVSTTAALPPRTAPVTRPLASSFRR